jgi:hypothetical protein
LRHLGNIIQNEGTGQSVAYQIFERVENSESLSRHARIRNVLEQIEEFNSEELHSIEADIIGEQLLYQ